MTGHDAFEANLASLFDDDAQAPIPAGGLERLNAAIASRQPRPARLAGLGGRWIGDPSPGTSPLGALRLTVPVIRLSAAVLLLLLTLALIGTAALIGGRLLAPGPEKLLYGLDGDIFLADADGGNPVRIAEGAELHRGDPWAPDGRHFLSYDTTGFTIDIRDADGHVVASLPDCCLATDWSPDSTRLQSWATRRGGQINIYGIDGALQAELPLPDGYARPLHYEGVWAPDGRSVWVQIAPVQGSPCADDSSGYPSECAALEIWELPIDGSAPRRVVEGLDIWSFEPTFSRDGTYLAFSGRDEAEAMELSVANADGTDARAVVRAGQGSDQGEGTAPIWSPSGETLAYIALRGNLNVVDIATGTARTLSTDWAYTNWPPHSWSRDGDRIMFSKQSGTQGGVALGDLWTVGVDGGEPTLLVEGATHGAWQPGGTTHSSDDLPGEGDDATPSPASTPSDAGVRPGASLIRIAGHDVSVVLPDGLAGRLPADGDAGNGISWGNNDEQAGRTGSRWTSWFLYAPREIDDPSRNDDGVLSLPSDPVAWLRQRPGLTVLAERDIEVGGKPARLLDVVRPEEGGAFSFEVPVGDSGAMRAFAVVGGTHSRLVMWQLGHTWMVAQANASDLSALETADAPSDRFMRFIADLRFP